MVLPGGEGGPEGVDGVWAARRAVSGSSAGSGCGVEKKERGLSRCVFAFPPRPIALHICHTHTHLLSGRSAATAALSRLQRLFSSHRRGVQRSRHVVPLGVAWVAPGLSGRPCGRGAGEGAERDGARGAGEREPGSPGGGEAHWRGV